MEYRNLGKSGLLVSALGIGGNNFGLKLDRAATERVVQAALDEGVTLFDTADGYAAGESEEFLGKALGSRRHEALISTKFGMPTGAGPYAMGGSRRHVLQAAEASLRRLGTDYIDLYQLHFPDPKTPIEETLEALDVLVQRGDVRYIGSSNVSGWEIAHADWMARSRQLSRFISTQAEWSLLSRDVEAEVIPACEQFGVGLLPYFPLASGLLTGKYRRDAEMPEGSRLALWSARSLDDSVPPPGSREELWQASWVLPMVERLTSKEAWDRLERVTRIAEERGHTILELALGWVASAPIVASVVVGATTPDQVRSNVAATLAWRLTAEERAEVVRALEGERE